MGQTVKTLARSRRSEEITAYLFLLPVTVLWFVWFLIPTAYSMFISLYKYSFVAVSQNHFVGLDNYIRALTDPAFYKALRNTLFLTFVAVPAQSLIAFVLAMALNLKIKFRDIFRTIYYVPYVVSTIAVTTVFMYLFVKGSPLNKFFSLLGFDNVTWYVDFKLALPFITIVYVWQQIGFYIVIFLSGLQTVPNELY